MVHKCIRELEKFVLCRIFRDAIEDTNAAHIRKEFVSKERFLTGTVIEGLIHHLLLFRNGRNILANAESRVVTPLSYTLVLM